MKLERLQADFWMMATQPGKAHAGLAEALFVGSPELDAASRMRIYANMYLWRQVDALREDFPKVVALVGDEAFFGVCERYVKQLPSVSPSITHLGSRFPRFLSRQRRLRADVAALAALEWARSEIFDEGDGQPLSAEVLRQTPGERLPGLAFELVPALQVVRLRRDVLPVWQALEEGGAPPPPSPAPVFAAVWRKDHRVFHAPLSPQEALALRRARAGAPLARVCAAFASEPDPAQAAVTAIGSWFVEGWVLAAFEKETP